MRILITGATGLVGTKLTSLLLSKGYEVNYLSTAAETIQKRQGDQGFFWDPIHGKIDEKALDGVEAIIHLAGAPISKRWTVSYKREITDSRILSANLLFKLLQKNPHQVKQFISASAIGIYEDSLSVIHDEGSVYFDSGFLGQVVRKWEAAADKIGSLGISVCKLRTGLVLSNKGGALPEMIKPVKVGLGSAIGRGRQWQSWIHIDDLASMYFHALENRLEGVYNAVAPNPVTNKYLMNAMASKLRKPFFMPNVPEFLLKLVLGEMHQLLTSSQNVSSGKIIRSGFKFTYTGVDHALESLLK